jgi:tryptophan synthase alpha chain
MSRIDQTFKRLQGKGQAALIPFIVAGDPDLEATEALVLKLAESEADLIELGVPFSDPIADGPTIQAASQRALKKGVSIESILSLTRRLKEVTPPLVLTTYFNPIFHYGLKHFAAGCKESRVDGVIVPDLPPEEAGPWIKEAREFALDTIFLAAPNRLSERIRRVDRFSRGFIYYVSITGVTGIRGKLPDNLEQAIKGIKKYTRKPVAVGFGISDPEQAKIVSNYTDGVIVGSAIIKIIEENLNCSNLVTKVGNFISSLAKAMKS